MLPNIITNKTHYLESIKTLLELGAIIAGIKINLFEILKNDYRTSLEIRTQLKLESENRNIEDFLDKLTVTGHLSRKKDINSSIYSYKIAHEGFIYSNPSNVISFYLMLNRFLIRLNNFPNLLQNGKTNISHNTFDQIYSNDEQTWNFLKTMSLMHKDEFIKIANLLELDKFNSFLDVGGGLGCLSVIIKKKFKHLECITADLKIIEKYVEKYLEIENMKNEIKIMTFNMLEDEYPKVDIVAMANLTNDWNYEKKSILFKNAYECLNENGIFLFIEQLVDKEVNKDNLALNLSFYMFMECGDGFSITFSELEKLSNSVGFKKIKDFRNDNVNLFICFK